MNTKLRAAYALLHLRKVGYWADYVNTLDGGLINVEDPLKEGLFVSLKVVREGVEHFVTDEDNYDYLMAAKS